MFKLLRLPKIVSEAIEKANQLDYEVDAELKESVLDRAADVLLEPKNSRHAKKLKRLEKRTRRLMF